VKKNYYKYKGKCIPECELGTVAYYGECLDCTNSRCKTCLDNDRSKCTSCKDNFVLNYYNCEDERCRDGQYLGLNNQCYDCSNGCDKCSSFTNCIQCSKGLKLVKNDEGVFCVKGDNYCKDGYTYINGECYPCNVENCKSCNIPLVSRCPECMKNYFLYNNLCIPKCPNGYYGYDKKCYKCPNNCKTCNINGECIDCFDQYYLMNKRCRYCRDQFYGIIKKECIRCEDDNCLQCEYSNVENKFKCKLCRYPYILFNDKCQSDCPIGYYRYEDTCLKCTYPCKQCSSPEKCEDCESGFFLHEDKCVENCPKNYTKDNKKCVKCSDPNCAACCSDNPSQCCECANNKFNYNKKCYDVCPYGTYPDKNKNCISCPDKCLRCDEHGKCKECEKGYKLEDGNCVVNCKTSFYYDFNSNTCYNCDDINCLECAPKNVCKKCNKPTILNKATKTCEYYCEKKYFIDSENNTCERCLDTCEKCDNKYNCTECINGYYLLRNGTCIENCGVSKTFVNGECLKCKDINCFTCENGEPDKCKICKNDFYLINYECTKDCPTGFYIYVDENGNYVCKRCDEKCTSCDPTGCNDCKPGFKKIHKKCVNPCPNGSTPYNGICAKCSVENCKTCDSELNKCIECDDDFFLYEGECVRQCKDGYYMEGKNCYPCSKNCRKCKNSKDCEDCTTILYNRQCVDKCPLKYYSFCNNGITRCENCMNGCTYCENGNRCIECESHLIKFRGQCIQSNQCPSGRYVDKENRLCKKM